MIVDANAVDDGAVLESTVCVVGAGAAGIPLALALARRGIDVTLLESGGLEPEVETQRLYDGANVGIPYSPSASRLRYFGGTTNHWGGMCHPLDEDDFLPREWIADSGWPIRRSDVEPYYDEALAVLEVPSRHRFTEVERDVAAFPYLLGAENPAFAPVLWLKSPPTRLGQTSRQAIADHPRIRCYLHANAVQVVPNAAADHVERIDVRTLGGRRVRCRARDYVLSAGGIENARLLLLSDAVVPGGLGNRHDLVGRYFMEHIAEFVGTMVVVPPRGARGFQEESVRERAGRDLVGVWNVFFGLGSTRAFRERHRLLGCVVNAIPKPPDADDPAARAVENLVRAGASDAPARSFGLYVTAERAPNRDSRISLGDDLDALGQRRVVVDLRPAPSDAHSVRKTVRAFGLELARAGHGRARIPEAEFQTTPLVGHHMGTTRMSDDPARGVTDRDGRVHEIANLYVAGSSLFPTGGYANPTMTIVALALRLAEHLGRVGSAAVPDVRSRG